MTDKTIGPALTREEWAVIGQRPVLEADHYGKPFLLAHAPNAADIDMAERPHAIAAAMLRNQPFGFTHGELVALIDILGVVDWDDIGELRRNLDSVRAKIAALLPPE